MKRTYSTAELKKMEEIRRNWRESKAEADKEVARVRKRSRALDPKDEASLDHWADILRQSVKMVDQYVTEALALRESHPDKPASWHDFQFPWAFYRHHNNQIRDARGRMESILAPYTYETVDYPDPELHGLTTYEKRVDYDRVHTSVWKYYTILDETVTLLAKDRNEFIARGGDPDLWKSPL